MRLFFSIAFSLIFLFGKGQAGLKHQDNQTLTYDEVMEVYQSVDEQYSQAKLLEYGPTDSGRNLHVLFLSNDAITDETDIHKLKQNKTVILVNNGIHAGESCGIDASILYARDLLEEGVPKNVLIAIIPVYNIGGVLNRNCCTRANQDGPEMHGFRGNARNLDLNRDFIKADALNTLSFYAIFHQLEPHVFVDTHTSNGADYQYTLTLITTQKDKINPVLGDFIEKKMEPNLYKNMAKTDWEMVPYVNVFGNNTPDKGYRAFLETPRYASGYTALFNTIGFITETHMLKPYKDRVESTRTFLNVLTDYCHQKSDLLQSKKKLAQEYDDLSKIMDLKWELDADTFTEIEFKGYEYEFITSKLTGLPRLKYYKDKPKTYSAKHFNTYKTSLSVTIPDYYVVPAAWYRVIQLLQYNQVEVIPLKKDTALEVYSTYISDFKFGNRPYEGHFPLNSLSTEMKVQERHFFKGDYLVASNQKNKRFLSSVLEPEAVDSYLKWNFYDEIFQQKEGFSAYVFEDTAVELLESTPGLKEKFEKWKKENPKEAENAHNQLAFIYHNSEAYEKEHLRYPVAKIFLAK